MAGADVIRRVLGGRVDRRVRSVVAVSFTYAVFSTFWIYVGVYVVKGLGAGTSDVGLLFLLSAPAAAVANYASGVVSDRVGSRGPIVASFAASAANMAVLALVGHRLALAFGLIVLQGVLGAPAYSLDRVLVADLVPEAAAREDAYATVRVAANLGTLAGPPAAALLIHLGGWSAFLLGLAAVAVAGAAITTIAVPRPAPGARARRPRVRVLAAVRRDRPFVLLLLSTLLGFVVYAGYETVLPVIAVSVYGIGASTWGLLVAVSPLLVVVAQMRLTRATARFDAAPRLAAAVLLMGLPFLALIVAADVQVIAAVIIVFVVGEMLWVPTSQALAADLAPAELRGGYFGVLAATTGPAWTLAPWIALHLRASLGVSAVWVFFAGSAAAGAGAGMAAARLARKKL